MKQIILLGLLLSVFVGCTKYNEINTGIAQKKYREICMNIFTPILTTGILCYC